MTTVETPVATPNVVPVNGILLTVEGEDVSNNSSTQGITSPAITIVDPSGVFTLTPAGDGLSATLVPNVPLVVGTATVTFNSTGGSGEDLTCTYDAQELPGDAVSVQFVATDLPAPAVPLSVEPTSVIAAVGDNVSQALVPAGGSGVGYTYASADLANLGLAIDVDGNITGTAVAGSATITVTDSAGASVDVPVTVS